MGHVVELSGPEREAIIEALRAERAGLEIAISNNKRQTRYLAGVDAQLVENTARVERRVEFITGLINRLDRL